MNRRYLSLSLFAIVFANVAADTSSVLAEANSGVFAAKIFTYTAVGWNVTDIDSSILEENLNVVSRAVKSNYNASALDAISIFPEYAFTTTGVMQNRTMALEMAQRVQEPSSTFIPCSLENDDPDNVVVQRLSCISRENFVYIVASLLEKVEIECQPEAADCDGFKIYSTTIVTDKNGYIIAKYRRFNLIDETALDKPSTLEPTSFTTDGNITFGLLTGYDLLFAEPTQTLLNMSVSHFISNGAWKNKMPFEFSNNVNFGWMEAYKNRNVFLATSNYLRSQEGFTGFGTYHVFPEGFATTESVGLGSGGYLSLESTLYPSTKRQSSSRELSELVVTESIDFDNFVSVPVPLSTQTREIKVCHGEFCCMLSYRTFSSSTQETFFQLVAFNGNRTAADGTVVFLEETCGLVACSEANITSCGASKLNTPYTSTVSFSRLSLTGNFSANYVRPVNMNGDGETYLSQSWVKLNVTELGERKFVATYTYNGGGSLANFKTFALTATDIPAPTPIKDSSGTITLNVVLLLFVLLAQLV